jgi:hypothetical protein
MAINVTPVAGLRIQAYSLPSSTQVQSNPENYPSWKFDGTTRWQPKFGRVLLAPETIFLMTIPGSTQFSHRSAELGHLV